MTQIAHLSDIHFGAVDRGALERLRDQINDAGVDAIIVTGDLTQAGRRSEFIDAANYLETFAARLLVVPGNHDAPVYNVGQRMTDPWRRFRRYIDDNLSPSLTVDGVFALGLNSARRANPSLDWSLGRLSQGQLDLAARELRRADEADLRLVAFHHPVTPGPGRAGQAVINNADRAVNCFAAAGADMLLTGHAHVARANLHEAGGRPIVVAAAGTATSTRLRGEAPSFNLLSWKGGRLSIEIHRYGEDGYVSEKSVRFARNDGAWLREDAS